MNIINKINNELNENKKDFIKDTKFVQAYRKYVPEFAKYFIQFLKQKGVKNIYSDSIKYISSDLNRDKIDLSNLKSDEKNNNPFKEYLRNVSSAARNTQLFQINPSSLSLPSFEYKEYIVSVIISTNSEFFENGHDIKILMFKEDKSYEHKDKIFLTGTVKEFFESLFAIVEVAVNSDKQERERVTYAPRKNNGSDITRIVNNLNKTVKKSKKGVKTISNDYEKNTVSFSFTMTDKSSDNIRRSFSDSEGFKLLYRVRKTKNVIPQQKRSFSRASLLNIPDDIKQLFPEAEKIVNTLKELGVAEGHITNYFSDMSTNEHEKIKDRIFIAMRKFINIGYLPTHAYNAYSNREENSINFKYSLKLAEKAKNDPSIAEKIFQSNKFKGDVARSLNINIKSIETLKKKLIYDVFKQIDGFRHL